MKICPRLGQMGYEKLGKVFNPISMIGLNLIYVRLSAAATEQTDADLGYQVTLQAT